MRRSINTTKYEAEAEWRRWKNHNQELYRALLSACAGCGSKTSLQIHHRDCDKRNNELSNLLCLCWECHRRLHNTMTVHYKVIIDENGGTQ